MFNELSRDQLSAVMKNLVYVYSSAWFKSEKIVMEKYGLDATLSEEFTQLFREFGSKESSKLVELSIVSGTGADSIVKGLQLSHWALFENIELTKLSDNMVRMRTIDCTRQRYAKKIWGTEYPCKDLIFSHEARIGFVKAINPKAEVRCSFCPPDDPRPKSIPENVSCEWIITIPK